ncbi:MAG: HlyD family efflux transporter periplasmic adaptor subunit [Bacteroidaceae bacterium]|nr:HlyD family efflux transporter periplasmic adaptor subunit [Bacteroidaceae bacterium]
MDRKLSRHERLRMRLGSWMRPAAMVTTAVMAVYGVVRMAERRYEAGQFTLSTAEYGRVEAGVGTTALVEAEVQQIVTSPISSRIMAVHHRVGDRVEAGDPLLSLDLQQATDNYQKAVEEEKMRRLKLVQLEAGQQTRLAGLRMKIRVAETTVSSRLRQVRGEEQLDSIGSGTTERVRLAQADYETACLELEQLRQQLRDEQTSARAEREVQQLELQVFRQELASLGRTLEQAQVRSPRAGTLTYLHSSVGAQVSPGEQLAVVSDLSSYRLRGEAPERYADRIVPGAQVRIRTGQVGLDGTVGSVNPLSQQGNIAFTVSLAEPDHPALRPGLRVEARILTQLRDSVLRISNGAFYEEPRAYSLFVREGNVLRRRNVRLGLGGYDYVEVLSGLRAGEQVAVGDMQDFAGRKEIRVK